MTPIESAEWTGSLISVLKDERRLHTVYQPIVDLQRGLVVGYEALSRFSGPPAATPEAWFAAAQMAGLTHELEAMALESAMRERIHLPKDTFLSININPNSLLSPEVQGVLGQEADLSRLVIEITERASIADYSEVAGALRRARHRGALVAVDDAGAGYANLLHIISLRPDFVKLDRSLVAGVDRDEAKIAIVDMLAGFASRINAWMVAEGIETDGELDAAINLNVPLGQGYLLGRPGPAWVEMEENLHGRIRERVEARKAAASVGALCEDTPSAPWWEWRSAAETIFVQSPENDVIVTVDEFARPIGMVLNQHNGVGPTLNEEILKVTEASDVIDVARRAVARCPEMRFAPIVCTDTSGRLVGVIRVERLVAILTG